MCVELRIYVCVGLARTVLTVYLMISLQKTLYIHRTYMVLANPVHVCVRVCGCVHVMALSILLML
jgi:hypothetical protein